LKLVQDASEIPSRPDIGWLAFGENGIKASLFPGKVMLLSPSGDLREAAVNLFRSLRALDDDAVVTTLYAANLPSVGLGLAINERLERAAH